MCENSIYVSAKVEDIMEHTAFIIIPIAKWDVVCDDPNRNTQV